MDRQSRHPVRRQLNLVGWGLLCCFLAAQIAAFLFYLVPAVRRRVLLSVVTDYVSIYLIGSAVLWLFLRRLPRGKAPGLSLSPRAFGRTAVVCLGTAYLFNFLTLVVIALLERSTGLASGNLLETTADSMPQWTYALLSCAVAPVCEELIFRRLLLDRLRPFGDRLAIVVSAAAFGLFHLNLYQLFYAFALGVLFAGVVLQTGKIRHSMALHAVVNLFSLLIGALPNTFGASLAVTAAVFALCFLAVWWICRWAPTYHFSPPTPPCSGRQVRRSLWSAPGIWACLLGSLCVSVGVIFLV